MNLILNIMIKFTYYNKTINNKIKKCYFSKSMILFNKSIKINIQYNLYQNHHLL